MSVNRRDLPIPDPLFYAWIVYLWQFQFHWKRQFLTTPLNSQQNYLDFLLSKNLLPHFCRKLILRSGILFDWMCFSSYYNALADLQACSTPSCFLLLASKNLTQLRLETEYLFTNILYNIKTKNKQNSKIRTKSGNFKKILVLTRTQTVIFKEKYIWFLEYVARYAFIGYGTTV